MIPMSASNTCLGSSASLPPEPMNRADQHLRGLKQEPGVSQTLDFMHFTCIDVMLCANC